MTSLDIKIRRFETSDQGKVIQLITDIMNGEFHEDRAAYPVDDIQDVKSTYGGIGESFFVASSNGSVLGTAGVKQEDTRTALLRRLFVDPAHRNKKIGKKLIESVLSFCDETGYEEVVFKATSRMQAAIQALQKSGFVVRAKVHLGQLELVKLSVMLSSGAKKLKS